MKKRTLIIPVLALFLVISLSGVLAASTCDLSVSLINQDPYPATPGDYVELVFQIEGVGNADCGRVQFGLLEQYPLIFDPDTVRTISVDAGTYQKDFSSFLMAPYKVRVDSNALDGENPIEVEFRSGADINYQTKQFNLEVQDTKADFEIHIKDYAPLTNTLTFEILNIENIDVEALTLEIPSQDNILIKGSKTNIIGDLDSNEYTTANFEATPSEGEILVKIIYTDSINKRRTLEKTVLFETVKVKFFDKNLFVQVLISDLQLKFKS